MREFNAVFAAVLIVALSGHHVTGQRPIVPKTQKPAIKTGPAAAPVPPPRASGNVTFVLSGTTIPTADSNSKADAFVTVFSKTGTAAEVELGRTETLKDQDNPIWNKVFWVDWKKGTGQKLRFVVKDYDTLSRSDVLGEVTVDVDEYVEKNQNMKVPLKNPADSPKIKGGFLSIQKVQPTKFLLYARNIPAKDPFSGKSDVYVEVFWRKGMNGTDIPLGTTEVIDDTETPDWKTQFEFANFQRGTEQYWYFHVYDKDSLSSDNIGDLLVPVDPFVAKRATSINKLKGSDGKATLAITPL